MNTDMGPKKQRHLPSLFFFYILDQITVYLIICLPAKRTKSSHLDRVKEISSLSIKNYNMELGNHTLWACKFNARCPKKKKTHWNCQHQNPGVLSLFGVSEIFQSLGCLVGLNALLKIVIKLDKTSSLILDSHGSIRWDGEHFEMATLRFIQTGISP